MVQGALQAGLRWVKSLHLRRPGRWWLVGAALLAACGIGGLLALEPLIRSEARKAAAERGVLLAVGDVSLGWGNVTLSDVGVSLSGADVVRGELRKVRVEWGFGLTPRALSAEGGRLVLTGSVERMKEQLARWQQQRPRATGGEATSSGMALSAQGLDVVWENPGAKAPLGTATGLRYARSPSGAEQLAMDSLALSHAAASLSVANASVQLERASGQRVLKQLSAGRVDATLALSDLSPSHPGKPGASAKAAKGPTSPDQAERPGSRLVHLLPELDAGRGGRLRAVVSELAKLAQAKLPPASTIDLDQLRLNLVHEDQKLHLGPNRFRLERFADRAELALLPGGADQTSPLTLKLSLPFGARAVKLGIEGGPASLAALGVEEGDFSLREVRRSELAMSGELILSPGGESLSVVGDGRLAPLTFENRSLSQQLLRGSALSWNGKARIQLDGSRYEIERFRFALGEVELNVAGSIEKHPGRVTADLHGGIPLASCQALLESAPEGLLPLLKGVKFAGTFALDAAVAFDTQDLSKMRVRWDFKNECRVTEVPLELSPRRFRNAFRMQVKDVTGRVVNIETGPGTPGWTPYPGISPHMETAVLICEDGRFFRHQGFDREAIENSIKENVKAGRFVRGASTISMQLAKNLYLSFDKTLSRKLQEAVLTTLLEQELTKEEMMELYLNVIEYGPGIYGIAAAARHYFDTTPAELSLGQSLYLASILPNPAQQHFTESGLLSEGWSNYLRRLMRIAVKIGRLSEAEYELALDEEVGFGMPSTRSTGGMFLGAPDVDEGGFGDFDDESTLPLAP